MKKLILLFIVAIFSVTLFAQKVYKDPIGDDKGHGTYVYPTDISYKKGSFDITEYYAKI